MDQRGGVAGVLLGFAKRDISAIGEFVSIREIHRGSPARYNYV
jgi:hypothetical protein